MGFSIWYIINDKLVWAVARNVDRVKKGHHYHDYIIWYADLTLLDGDTKSQEAIPVMMIIHRFMYQHTILSATWSVVSLLPYLHWWHCSDMFHCSWYHTTMKWK